MRCFPIIIFIFSMAIIFPPLSFADFRINDDSTNAADYTSYNALAHASNGSFMVVWERRIGATFGDAFYRMFDMSANPLGPSNTVSSDPDNEIGSNAHVAFGGNQFVAIYQRSYTGGVNYRRFNSSGVPIGTSSVLTPTQTGHPDLAVFPDGGFVLVWEDYQGAEGTWDVLARRYSANGNPNGDAVTVAGSGTADEESPKVVANTDGRFAVVWEWTTSSQIEIYIRFYSSTGEPMGAEMRVNTITSGWQENACAAWTPSNHLLVVWEDDRNGDYDIWGQWYTINGQPIDTNFAIYTGTGNQQGAVVSFDQLSGLGWIVWHDDRNGNADIFGRAIDSEGDLFGTEFRIDSVTNTSVQEWPSIKTFDCHAYVLWRDYRNQPIYSADIWGTIVQPPHLPMVTGVTASNLSHDSIWVVWNGLQQADSFHVIRDDIQIGSTVANDTDFTDNMASPNTWHVYQIVAVNACGVSDTSAADSGFYSTDVRQIDIGLPTAYCLYQNYPNPFNPKTTIAFDLIKNTNVSLKVFNVLGREVATLIDDPMEAGQHTVDFDGSELASGVYFCRMEANGQVFEQKMLLMK